MDVGNVGDVLRDPAERPLSRLVLLDDALFQKLAGILGGEECLDDDRYRVGRINRQRFIELSPVQIPVRIGGLAYEMGKAWCHQWGFSSCLRGSWRQGVEKGGFGAGVGHNGQRESRDGRTWRRRQKPVRESASEGGLPHPALIACDDKKRLAVRLDQRGDLASEFSRVS